MLIHKLWILLLFAIAANLDNLGVGIAYGLRREACTLPNCGRILPQSNLAIAVLSICLTFLSMKFGQSIEPILPARIASILGAGTIVIVGVWVFFEREIQQILSRFRHWLDRHFQTKISKKILVNPISSKPKRNILSRFLAIEQPGGISAGETIVLGFSLSLNAMAGGFGAGLAGHNPISTSIAVGTFSYLTIAVGQNVASTYAGKWLGSISQKIAGLLLMAIGIYELVF